MVGGWMGALLLSLMGGSHVIVHHATTDPHHRPNLTDRLRECFLHFTLKCFRDIKNNDLFYEFMDFISILDLSKY